MNHPVYRTWEKMLIGIVTGFRRDDFVSHARETGGISTRAGAEIENEARLFRKQVEQPAVRRLEVEALVGSRRPFGGRLYQAIARDDIRRLPYRGDRLAASGVWPRAVPRSPSVQRNDSARWTSRDLTAGAKVPVPQS